MPRAAVRSVPSRPARRPQPTAQPIAARRRWPGLAAALALCLAFGAGNLAPDLRPPQTERVAPVVAASTLAESRQPTEFPREAAALRAAIDRGAPPPALAELLDRLGILGDTSDFDRLAAAAEHPNGTVIHSALRALARIGGDRGVDRLTVFAKSNDDTLAIPALQALGLANEPEAVDLLLDVARNRADWRKNIALEALSLRGGSRARAALHEGLRTGPATDAYLWAGAVAGLGGPQDRFLLMTIAGGMGPRADAAIHALAALGSADSDALLVELAANATGSRRVTALSALGSVRDARAVDVLVDALSGSVNVRSAALGALGVSRAPGALDGLLLSLDHIRPDEAWQLTGALVNRPERQAREVLQLLAREDGSLGAAALASLSQVGDPLVGELLLDAFDTRGELPPDSTYTFLALHGGEDGWSLLEEVLADGSSQQRQAVIYALQTRGDTDSVTRLLDIAASDDPWVASSAMGSLEHLGEEARAGLRGLLMTRLEDDEGNFAENASTLARLGGEDVRDLLLGRLGEGTAQERSVALQALGQMEDPAARDAVRATLSSDDPMLRQQAFDALAWGPDPLDLVTLEGVLADEDPSLRQRAVSALASLGEPEARDRLLELTGADEPELRTAALSALSSVGGPDAEAALVSALDDPETFDTAVWSLSSVGTRGAREAIREAATHGDPAQRLTALNALGSDSSTGARDVLIGALDDADEGVVTTALSQLQMHGSTAAAEAVAQLLTAVQGDEDSSIRYQAANTLQALGGATARAHQDLLDSILGGHYESLNLEAHGSYDWEHMPPHYYLH